MARFFKRTPALSGADEAVPETPPRKPRDIQPDPDRIGISGSVPFVRLPDPARLFSDRARRFAALAPEHPLGAYLGFLARIAQAQGRVQAEHPFTPLLPGDVALRLEYGMPALPRNIVTEDPACLACLDAVLAAVDLDGAPVAALAARDALRAASPEDRLDLAGQIFEGAIPVERMAECVFVAAGLQVYLAACAAALDSRALKPVADGVCPACGSAPTASLIVSWTPADKARYLSCSQCATLWNHVRIRCTACGSGEGVSYYGLDAVSKDVQVETCTACHGYLKHLHQHRDAALDPVADDVASYGLDLKIAEEGFRKAGLNLLFVG